MTKSTKNQNNKKVNKFLTFRKWLENNISNKVKYVTGNDLFDWISLIILFGGGSTSILLLKYFSVISIGETLQAFILWFTVFVIIRYTKETYYLKKISQKQSITDIRPYLALQWEEYEEKNIKEGIVLKNIGQGVAVDLSFEYTGSKQHIHFNKVPALSNAGLTRSFVPNNQNIDLDPKALYTVKVNYKDIEDRKYYAKFQTNLDYNDKFVILEQKEI